MTTFRWTCAAVLFAVLAPPLDAFAQASAGVSDERVVLPGAPGSIAGVGENVSFEGNQGAMSYSIGIDVPQGFPGVTPDLSLDYSSNSGSDVLGMGWSMPNLSIERMTSKGLQQYVVDDRFVAEGGDELVRVAQTSTDATYRSRFESGFVRYTWLARGTGEGGYWKAEYPDGRVGYYGADSSGAAVAAARVTVPSTNKVFRWHLVTVVDRFGHAMQYSWTKDPGGMSLLDRVDYLFDAGQPRHSVRLTYESRNDLISDGRPGFELQLTQRLKDVRIYSGAELIRVYLVAYETEAAAGGATRLKSVSRVGRTNVAYPVTFDFAYSQTLGGACTTDCAKPFVQSMGTLGTAANFSLGQATFIDINGDALPDILTSTSSGVHSFYYANLQAEGRATFSTTPVQSTRTVGSSSFVLGAPAVQVIDINGDGFVDITNPKTPDVLCNNGSGDWVAASFCAPTNSGVSSTFDMPDDADPTQADPRGIRFFDYDNDKRIDFLKTEAGGTTTVLANTPAGYVSNTVTAIGKVFDTDPSLQLADMNGDGLQDPVTLEASGSAILISYRLNLGYGSWGPWLTYTLSGLDPSQIANAELQDINGDGLADVVAVVGNEIKLALNRNGNRFDAVRTIATADLGSGVIPSRSGALVSFADMNGNGSLDVVWIESTGAISYLELFPLRPNLLTRISNAIGHVQRISYGTSINEAARDEAALKPWLNKLPNPMTVVTAMESFVTLTGTDLNGTAAPSGLRELIQVRYHSGYYDGVEKQFRGYESVERQLDSDLSRDAQEPGLIVEEYDVGKTNPLLAGRKVKEVTWAGPGPNRALLREDRMLWAACPVAQSTGTSFACETAITSITTERDPANAVTTRIEREFDGYGNLTRERELGVVNLGTPENPRACGPCVSSGSFGDACGAQCMGDETYVENDFIVPGTNTGNLWLIGQTSEMRTGVVAGTWSQISRRYYDLPDFEGLPLGQLTVGNVSRVERLLGTSYVTVTRSRYDAHGNVAEMIDALGTVADSTRHRRVYSFDPEGLNLKSVEIRLGGADASAVKRDFATDPIWEAKSQSSNWYPVQGATPLATPQLTRYRYDEHGRLSKMLLPGDLDTAPSVDVTYDLADPASRIVVTRRAAASGTAPLVEATCFDGRGRQFQRRQQVSANSWHVDGFMEFDARGQPVRRYQAYLGTSGACETAPPTSVPFSRFVYDPEGRMLSETEPDGSIRRVEYGPLVVRRFDEGDTDPGDSTYNTPDVETYDGLGRLTSISRSLQSGGQPSVNRFGYDAMGKVSVVRDAAGNLHTQTADSFGRVVSLTDPNAGTLALEYDVQGNVISTTDARGKVMKVEYDGANRVSARYDPTDEAQTRVTYTYDRLVGCTECTNAGGQPVKMTWPGANAAGEEVFGYDARGNPVFTRKTIAGHALTTRRRYDVALRLTGVTFPDGTSFDTTYDGAGRPIAVSGAVTAAEYNERGETSRIRFANGVVTDYAYDGRVRLASIKTTGKDGTPLLSLGMTRSASGELMALDDGALSGRVRHGGAFTFDAWGRLTRAVLPGAAGDETVDYGFDPIDNITRAVSSLGASSRANMGDYTYEASRPNAVTAAGALSMTYDAAGSLATRGEISYTRDYRGRLVGASSPDASASFTYSDRERIAREVGDSTTWYVDRDFEVRDGISVAYAVLDGQRVLRTQSDALAATLLSDLAPATGAGPLTVTGDSKIDIADAWLAQAAGAGLVQLSGGPAASGVGALLQSAARRLLIEDAVWMHQDHLNSAVLATDSNGALRGEQSFYPTGSVREVHGYVGTKGFTDQEFDEATGLLHFSARELDTRTGRWDSPDPAFLVLNDQNVQKLGEFNSGYAYVANDFVGAYDPTGLGAKFNKVKSAAGSVKKAVGAFGSRRAANVRSVKNGAVALGKKLADKLNAGKDKVNAKLEGVAHDEYNARHEIGPAETVANYVGVAVTIASLAASLANLIQNLEGKTDEEHGKLPGLQNATTGLAVASGVMTVVNVTPKAHRAYKAKPIKGKTVASSTDPTPAAPSAGSTQSTSPSVTVHGT